MVDDGTSRTRASKKAHGSKLVDPRLIQHHKLRRIAYLESDNFHEDPNPNLDNFINTDDDEAGFRKKKRARHKRRVRRTLAAIAEEQKLYVNPAMPLGARRNVANQRPIPSATAYYDAKAKPSKYPPPAKLDQDLFRVKYLNLAK